MKARFQIARAAAVGALPESRRVGVAGLTVQVGFLDGRLLVVSFYLRLSGATSTGRETLGGRLNDPDTRFLPCKVDDRVEILNLSAISVVRVAGPLPELEALERQGAVRLPARVALACGETLLGDFLCRLPSPQTRLSDLLNATDQRFLPFLVEEQPVYLQRDSIVRVVPVP